MPPKENSCLLCQEAGPLEVLLPPREGNWGPHPYFQCPNCGFVFLDPAQYMSSEAEKKRYQLHQNSKLDQGYLNYLNPVLEFIKNFPQSAVGLDFGAGENPVLAELIISTGKKMFLFDPIFQPYAENLARKYDFIVCTEVVEHFHHPQREFALLRSLLSPGGSLIMMTQMLPAKDFYQWHYRRDPTHVGFYCEKSMSWIKHFYKFKQMSLINSSVVVLTS